MTSLILVTGGTGTLGRQVAARLRDAGGKVRVLSRRSHAPSDGIEYVTGDLLTGEGVGPAVDGAGVIVHCASGNKGDADATRNLVRAASSLPEAPHLVYISIVGSDLVSFGYTREKLEAERLVSGSGLPWTTLRVTQFYDLIFKGARALARLPVVPVPAGFVIQPVNSGEVAARLAELALAGQGRPGARHGRPAGDQLRRPTARVPAGEPPPPPGRAGMDAGHPRGPRRRPAGPSRAGRRARVCRRPADVGRVPGRQAAPAGTRPLREGRRL